MVSLVVNWKLLHMTDPLDEQNASDKNATATWWHTFWWWKQNTWISNGFPSHQEYHILPKDAKQALKWLAWHEAVNRKSHIQPEVRVERGVSTSNHMNNHSELELSLTNWGWKEVWAWAITVNFTYLLRVERGVSMSNQWLRIVTYNLRVERGVSISNHSELGLSHTSWGWKEVWAWAWAMSQDCHLLPESGKMYEHEQSQWIGIVTYFLRVERGVSMSNHSELGLSLTCWGWKEVWVWTITMDWECHLQAKGGKMCEHEQSQWIGIVNLSLTRWGWKEVWAWASTVNWDCHLLPKGGKKCEYD